jgi:hypothetical protein
MKSEDLTPGTRLRYKPNGSIAILDRRKDPNDHDASKGRFFPGWWVEGGGGLADFVIDDAESVWEIV